MVNSANLFISISWMSELWEEEAEPEPMGTDDAVNRHCHQDD